MRNRAIIVPVAAAVLTALTAAAVLAQNTQGQRRSQRNALVIREPRPVSTLMVNGRPASSDVDPQMIEGRMMVPIRFVAQELGATVTWDPNTRVVRLLKGNDSVTMTVGSTRADRNGLAQALAVAPLIRNGRTLLPLRDVARFTGGIADYNESTGVVFVTTAGGRGSVGAGTRGRIR